MEAAITPNTKVLYCETVSNPLLEVADIAGLAKIESVYGGIGNSENGKNILKQISSTYP